MSKKNLIAIALLAFVIFLSPAQATEDQSLNLRPGKIHESCHKLERGSKLNYSFQVSSETLFNVHFHAGKVIEYPVTEQLALESSGSVAVETTQTYCLMWTNPQDHTVTLRYNVDIVSR